MRLTALCVFGLVAILTQAGCSSYEFRSEDSIRNSLTRQTPLGSSPEAVLSLVHREGWLSVGYDPKVGFVPDGTPYPKWPGFSTIGARIGKYYLNPFVFTQVSAFWIFDKDQKLAEIRIGHATTGL
jgi:hypothetical protein